MFRKPHSLSRPVQDLMKRKFKNIGLVSDECLYMNLTGTFKPSLPSLCLQDAAQIALTIVKCGMYRYNLCRNGYL